MTIDTRFRPAHPDDAERIAEIWRVGWADGHLGHVPEKLVAVRTEESFAARARHRVEDATVLIVDGAVAGFVMVVDDEVEQVYLAREHRGSGVASALIAEAERLVSEGGYEQAWLGVVAGNARARGFYERNGWRDEGLFDYAAADVDGPIPLRCHRYVKALS
ncbi:GNAT family N-acetyltransferase [Amycolatopsis sp. CA-230715]|uniref:GNAT family N-acetyltransferase n=1 Tax=Amycolatopsis sp. CA-230715 TaxID=2745196 RepID=UPI001C32B4FC|nr:GNAT family N-acetyltransferase [Amycolatopsis sp. CA-230715]QWF78076.1 hypothetical protein HUW46_01471 [Amycolatopsis sp. CA-230715]